MRPDCRGRDERGAALFLLPVGVLIVLLLGALVADTALVFLAEREVVNGATAAANDAAAAAIDVDHLRRTGEIQLDPARAEELAVEAVRRRTADLFVAPPTVRARVTGPDTLIVEVTGTVDGVLWSPVGSFDRSVGARITARPALGPTD
jgi:hypothetical protein